LSGTPIGNFNNKHVGSGKSVTVSGLSLTGADADNYTLTLPILQASITPASLNVTGLTANNKVYD
ncbi:MAG: YDG domain-containing protein, partial [Myxococcales bacterium]|nr:YDG domain-containing protein [Myxococcales bacterium]